MNPVIQLKQTSSVFLLVFGLACFGLSPQVQAISPSPDGCYPNFTTAEGCNALNLLTTGAGNTAVGWRSLFSESTGSSNTAVGAGALVLNDADGNTAVGAAALLLSTTGFGNTALGVDALGNNAGGNDNTAVGTSAGVAYTGTESLNVSIGAGVIGVTGESNTIRIAPNLPTTSGASACHIGGIWDQATVDPATTVGVVIDQFGKLAQFVSSRRYKCDIKPMDKTSEVILALQPVTFHYNSDKKNTPCFGLIAEDVAAVNPALVVLDKEGKPQTVRYEQINAMLLNEFLKEHSTVQELKKEVAALTTTVKEQASQIQKVTAQLELNKPTQTVVNNQ